MFMGLLHHLMLKIKFWVGEFKRGRTSLEDEARSERPLDATDEEMCKKVRDLVYSDSWMRRPTGDQEVAVQPPPRSATFFRGD